MGQTLTHGVYLPDEGERNCYNGLAANWQLLDNSVGTVAAHTTQIAGKAPAVHTHTKADITDFPAYGNAAGTICEGNDSRLSDARTPVAHTHGKADITDLFNSANTWTGENTFTTNNTNFKRSFTLGDNSYNICRLQYQDASLTRWGTLNFIHNTDNSVNCDLGVVAKKENDTVNVNASIRLTIKPDNSAEFIPLNNNKINLGTSANQWNNLYAKKVNTQSVNGVNPGALSLPNYDDTTYIDISGSIVPPSGETTINYSGGDNQYTPPVDGWLSIRCDGATFLQIYRNAYNCPGTTASRPTASGKLVVTLPVLKDKTYTIKINTSGTTNLFQLYPCLGNV